MKNSKLIKIIFIICFAIFSVFLGIIVGGKIENIRDILEIILHKLFGFNIDESISQTKISIIWDIRLPRVLLSFLVEEILLIISLLLISKNSESKTKTLGLISLYVLRALVPEPVPITFKLLQLFIRNWQ